MNQVSICARLAWLVLPLIALVLSACATTKPPGGEFATFDGRRLEYATAGQGAPAIILLSGYELEMGRNWGKVLPKVSEFGSVFTYNRFGDGRSDAAQTPQTGSAVVATLRRLLQERGPKPPYLLVGHSIGGVYANLYARSHPDEVAGVVMVDATHPEQDARWRGHKGWAQRALWGTKLALSSRNAEIQFFEETAREVREAGPFPDIPLTVITAGVDPPRWLSARKVMEIHRDNQRELAALSPKGKQIIAEKSGHLIPMEQPEIVIQAIAEMAAQIREGQ